MPNLANIAVMKRDGTNFDDLAGDLDAEPTAAQTTGTAMHAAVEAFYGQPEEKAPGLVICDKCKGSGRYRTKGSFGRPGRDLGPCFPCKGSGSVRPSVNKAARTRAANALALPAQIEAFKASNPDLMAYCGRVQNDFTANCLRMLSTKGAFTVNQINAIRASLERASKARAERVAAAPSVAGEGFTRLLQAFTHAAGTGLKSPTMKCREMVFSLARPTSNNAGHVYVKIGGNYKGKITPAGVFLAARETTREETAEVMRIGRDPFAAAVEHGRLTGCCAICSRKLVDPASVSRGIGPICAEKMGWVL